MTWRSGFLSVAAMIATALTPQSVPKPRHAPADTPFPLGFEGRSPGALPGR